MKARNVGGRLIKEVGLGVEKGLSLQDVGLEWVSSAIDFYVQRCNECEVDRDQLVKDGVKEDLINEVLKVRYGAIILKYYDLDPFEKVDEIAKMVWSRVSKRLKSFIYYINYWIGDVNDWNVLYKTDNGYRGVLVGSGGKGNHSIGNKKMVIDVRIKVGVQLNYKLDAYIVEDDYEEIG